MNQIYPSGFRSGTWFPDSLRFAFAGWDGSVRVVDRRDHKQLWSVSLPVGTNVILVTDDGKLLMAGGTDGVIRVFNALTGVEVMRLPGHQGEVTAMLFGQDRRRLLVGDSTGRIYIWSKEDEKEVFRAQALEGPVLMMEWCPMSRDLFVSGLGGAQVLRGHNR